MSAVVMYTHEVIGTSAMRFNRNARRTDERSAAQRNTELELFIIRHSKAHKAPEPGIHNHKREKRKDETRTRDKVLILGPLDSAWTLQPGQIANSKSSQLLTVNMEERGQRGRRHDGQSQGHGRRSGLTLARRPSVHSLHDVDADVYQYQDPGADDFSDAEAGELDPHSNRDGRSMTAGTESRTGARVRVRASTSASPAGEATMTGTGIGIHQPTATSSQELSKERHRQRQAARQLAADLASNQHAKNLSEFLI